MEFEVDPKISQRSIWSTLSWNASRTGPDSFQGFRLCFFCRALRRGPTRLPFLYTGNTIEALALLRPFFSIRLVPRGVDLVAGQDSVTRSISIPVYAAPTSALCPRRHTSMSAPYHHQLFGALCSLLYPSFSSPLAL